MNVDNSTQQDGTTMRETQSMLLERIASEMNRLKFYMAHAQVSIIQFYIAIFIDYIMNAPLPFTLQSVNI